MSRREDKIIALAGALQPQGFDLSSLKQRSVRDRRFRLRSDVAAGALAFAATPMLMDGELVQGDPLAPLLLRLKYADQRSEAAFKRAYLILLRRAGFNRHRRPTDALVAVARFAVIEWVQDACPKCRGAEAGQVKSRPCLECGQKVATQDLKGAPLHEPVMVGQPTPGCPKCWGMGRIFARTPAPKGMLCSACDNSGRRAPLDARARWRLVSDFIARTQRARGEREMGFTLDDFRTHFAGRYHRFIDMLREVDKRIVADVDIGWAASGLRLHVAGDGEDDDAQRG